MIRKPAILEDSLQFLNVADFITIQKNKNISHDV